MTFSTVYLLFCWWSNQQRFLRLNKQSNATEPRKTSVAPRESSFMRFHSSAIFLSETGRFIPEYTRVFVLFAPRSRPSAFSHFPQYLAQKFDTRFLLCVDLRCRTRSPIPSRPGDIFLLFFYYSILSRLSCLPLDPDCRCCFRLRHPAWTVKKNSQSSSLIDVYFIDRPFIWSPVY